MTTLILAIKSDRSIAGRCGARCYDAKRPKCKCICAGMNHGKGFTAAVRNTSFNADLRQTAHAAVNILFPHVQHHLFKGGNT